MQLLMRRPEIDGFVCVAPPANLYDYSFLAPCPSSGILISGERDKVVPPAAVEEMSRKTKTQKGIKIEHTIVSGAGHFFEDKNEELKKIVGEYVDHRMVEIEKAKREAE
jgi:alpha/beta superfamily hydrolase